MAEKTNKQRKRSQKQSYHAEHNRRGHSSTTTGKSKGIVATPLQRSYCARNRSYKRPDYSAVMGSVGKRHGKGAN